MKKPREIKTNGDDPAIEEMRKDMQQVRESNAEIQEDLEDISEDIVGLADLPEIAEDDT